MNCSTCGATVGEGDAFCGSCGNAVGAAAGTDAGGAVGAPAEPAPPSPQYGLASDQYGTAQPAAPSPAPPPPPPQYGTPPPSAPPPPAYPGAGGYRFQDPVSGAPTAEWWQRAVALIIDWFVVGIPVVILIVIVFAATATTTYNAFGQQVTTHSGAAEVLAYVISIAGYGAYYVLLNGGERGQTVGKMAMGIATRDETGQSPIGYGRAAGRFGIVFICGFFCGIALLLDYLWPLWDPRRQAWHDKVAHSLVVSVR